MSRHKFVRNIKNHDYDDDEEFGRSLEEDNFCVSPNTASQFMYRRNDSDKNISRPPTLMEEDYQAEDDVYSALQQQASSPKKVENVDQGRLTSCIDYIESCAGEAFTREELVRSVLAANYNAELALQLLLEHEVLGTMSGDTSFSKPPLPLLTKQMDNLSVSDHATASLRQQKDEPFKPNIRKVLAEHDPTLPSADSSRQQKPTSVKLPDWTMNFIAGANEYFSNVAKELQAKQVHTRLTRPESTPDFRNLNIGRSPAGTPTPGSPKAYRRSLKEPGIAPSPATTPVPGSPKSQRKSKDKLPPLKIPGKVDETPGDGQKQPDVQARTAKITTLYEQRQAASKPLINLIVIGHVDAGKSTLMGHVLFLLGKVDPKQMAKFEHEAKKIGKSSFMYAWVLDETGEERSRGVTIDVAHTTFETSNRLVNLMDAPGHKDFIPNMITGAAEADVAILVVDATRGEFETGFDTGGQTREHTLLARSLGVTQLVVVVNKMDNVEWSQERFNFIVSTLSKFLKAIGFKDADISFIPCSGFTGDNLTSRLSLEPARWWTGPSLLEQIDNFRPPVRQIDKPYRQVITDVFRSAAGGFCVAGKIEAGHVQLGDRVVVMPSGSAGTVKSITMDSGTCNNAFAGDNTMIVLNGVDILNVHVGDIICDAAQPVAVATKIRARIAMFAPKVPLLAGVDCVFHRQSYTESCVIRKLLSQINRSTGEVQKKNPRMLTKNTTGEVEILLQRPMCAELYSASKELGRFMLRDSGSTIAAGLVTEILG